MPDIFSRVATTDRRLHAADAIDDALATGEAVRHHGCVFQLATHEIAPAEVDRWRKLRAELGQAVFWQKPPRSLRFAIAEGDFGGLFLFRQRQLRYSVSDPRWQMKPTVQAILLADRVYQDKSNKFIIAGVFDVHLFMVNKRDDSEAAEVGSGTVKKSFLEIQSVGNPWVYISLTDVKSSVTLELRFESLTSGMVHFSTHITVVPTGDPLSSQQIGLPVPKLPNVPGTYVLDLLYEQTSIGTHRVRVIDLDEQKQSGEGQ